jgi:hypothetical protein
VFIAWQQRQIARNKLRLDLFDRRYRVYDATRKFLSVILRDATFTDSQLFEFYGGTSDTEFLFGSDVVDYLANRYESALLICACIRSCSNIWPLVMSVRVTCRQNTISSCGLQIRSQR